MKEGVWIQDPDPKPWEGKRGGGRGGCMAKPAQKPNRVDGCLGGDVDLQNYCMQII